MSLENLIALADIKERQALAYTEVYMNKVSNEELQKEIDNYCEQMAKSFIEEHSLLEDEQMLCGIRRHILSLGANKKHSGYRFYEMLYTQLNILQQESVIKNI